MNKILSCVAIFLIALSAVAQTGGGFNLEQNVIGDRGWKSERSGFPILGTMVQSNAGSTAAGGIFHLIDGLWSAENLTTTCDHHGQPPTFRIQSELDCPVLNEPHPDNDAPDDEANDHFKEQRRG